MSSQKNTIEKVKPLVQKFIKKIQVQNIPVKKVYIFGSHAKGKTHKYSDIDVCIISSHFKDRLSATQYLFKLRDTEELDIEPVAFAPRDFVDENPLVWEIKQHGIEVPLKEISRVEKKRLFTENGLTEDQELDVLQRENEILHFLQQGKIRAKSGRRIIKELNA